MADPEADKALGAIEKFSGLISTIANVVLPNYKACALDSACEEFENALASSPDAAETARLRYKMASNELYERILKLGNRLTANVLDFKAIAAN